jgi:5-methylcytosine-specific restriction endonuclease McrA
MSARADFWEADHIVPVAEGGGESSLDNFQTLCTPCHAKKTRQQAQDKERRKREEAAAGTADLRAFMVRTG